MAQSWKTSFDGKINHCLLQPPQSGGFFLHNFAVLHLLRFATCWWFRGWCLDEYNGVAISGVHAEVMPLLQRFAACLVIITSVYSFSPQQYLFEISWWLKLQVFFNFAHCIPQCLSPIVTKCRYRACNLDITMLSVLKLQFSQMLILHCHST